MLVILLELIRYIIEIYYVNFHVFAMLNFCGKYIEVDICDLLQEKGPLGIFINIEFLA